jgi:hypothetical protein
MTTAEKIETIVLCKLQYGTRTGKFGTIDRLLDGYNVTADGRVFLVRSCPEGWSVYHNGIEAIDESLYGAASLCLHP